MQSITATLELLQGPQVARAALEARLSAEEQEAGARQRPPVG
jgi:hypothetical protein